MRKKAPIVISLGGSLVAPGEINVPFLKKFTQIIDGEVRKGRRFILIVGGGHIAREFQRAAKKVTKLTPDDLDWLGIHATRLNAHLLRTIFRRYAHPQIITSKEKINSRIRSKIIIAAGFRPGSSTDLRAVQLAKAYGASTVLNLSNIDWVYTKDPRKYKSAKRIEEISWKNFRSIVGNSWDPGANVPFDPVASRYAHKWGMRVIITNGSDYANLRNILRDAKSKGTIVS